MGGNAAALAAAWPGVGLGLDPVTALVAAYCCAAACALGMAAWLRLRLRSPHLLEAPGKLLPGVGGRRRAVRLQ